MEKLSKNKLKELGFTHTSWSEWTNGSVFVEFYPRDKEMTVYVSAQNTSGILDAQPALGVKNEADLANLCKLVNGDS